MNLYVLHEGELTEKKVYQAWIRHAFADLREVQLASELGGGSFFLISGGGYPEYERRYRDAICEVRDNPSIDHLFVCVDSDGWTRERRAAEVRERLEGLARVHDLRSGNDHVEVHVIVQHVCLETWFLGNRSMTLRSTPTATFAEYLAHHDVRALDPEAMPLLKRPDHRNVQRFHQAYLRELLKNCEPPLQYIKSRPEAVITRDYFDALRSRLLETDHMPSLRHLLDTWNALIDRAPSR
jgi:hypothetical protein